jgi:hypothetical protein
VRPDSFTAEPALRTTDACVDVNRACRVITWSYLAGLLTIFGVLAYSLIIDFDFTVLIFSWLLFVGGAALTVWLAEWVASKLLLRRNWMRWLITCTWLVGAVGGPISTSLSEYAHWFRIQPIMAIGGMFQWGLSTAVVVLLNTKSSRAWFTSSQEIPERAA